MPLGNSRGLRTTTELSPPSFEFERKNSMISFIVGTRISSFSIKICRETCRVRHSSTSHGPTHRKNHFSPKHHPKGCAPRGSNVQGFGGVYIDLHIAGTFGGCCYLQTVRRSLGKPGTAR